MLGAGASASCPPLEKEWVGVTSEKQARDIWTIVAILQMSEPEWKLMHYLKIVTHYPVDLNNLYE